MFRGKESSNRIELSQLVQDLLNFGVLGSLRVWRWGVGGWGLGVVGGWGVVGVWGWLGVGCGWGGGGWLGGTPTHMHMHAHAHVVNMIISCKWPPPLGESLGIPYDVIHTCMCMHARTCAHGWGAPSHHPPPPSTHPPPPGGTPGISQNSIALELIEIFQSCLKI